MISLLMSIKPCVFETSGDRLSVQLMKVALRSEKSRSIWLFTDVLLAGDCLLGDSPTQGVIRYNRLQREALHLIFAVLSAALHWFLNAICSGSPAGLLQKKSSASL